MSEKRYMDVDELSRHLGISKWMICKYVKNREVPFIPFGRLVRFDRLAVEKWAEKKMVRDGGRFKRVPPDVLRMAESLMWMERRDEETGEREAVAIGGDSENQN